MPVMFERKIGRSSRCAANCVLQNTPSETSETGVRLRVVFLLALWTKGESTPRADQGGGRKGEREGAAEGYTRKADLVHLSRQLRGQLSPSSKHRNILPWRESREERVSSLPSSPPPGCTTCPRREQKSTPDRLDGCRRNALRGVCLLACLFGCSVGLVPAGVPDKKTR